MTKSNNLESRAIFYNGLPAKVTRLDRNNISIEYEEKRYLTKPQPSKCFPGAEIYPCYTLDEKGKEQELTDYDTFIMLYIIYQRFLEAEAKDGKKQ